MYFDKKIHAYIIMTDTIKFIRNALGLNNSVQFLTTQQTAAILGMPVECLNRWRREGLAKLPFHKFNRTIRYRIDSVAEFMDNTVCHNTIQGAAMT